MDEITNYEVPDVIDINKELYNASKRVERGTITLFELAEKKADSERNYRRKLAKEQLRLRDKEGMAVGLIEDVSRGHLADERYQRDLDVAMYKAGRDNLKAIQSQINALQSILRIQKEI